MLLDKKHPAAHNGSDIVGRESALCHRFVGSIATEWYICTVDPRYLDLAYNE